MESDDLATVGTRTYLHDSDNVWIWSEITIMTLDLPMWQHDDSVDLIRKLQPFAHHAGYHLGLAGGVLNVGHSRHDLDILVMPLDDRSNRHLKGLWNACQLVSNIQDIEEITQNYPQAAGRTIWRGTVNEFQVIDFFVFERLPVRERMRRWIHQIRTRLWKKNT